MSFSMNDLKSVAVTALALGAAFTQSANAGDIATLDVIGFSKDGKYLAFEQYGTQDGSGFDYSEIFFVDVARNTYAANPVRVLIEDDGDGTSDRVARVEATAKALPFLVALGIESGNTGRKVVSHPLSDLSADPYSVRFSTSHYVARGYHWDDYRLDLKVSGKKGDCYAEHAPKLLEVTLTNGTEKTQRTLQKDKRVPRSRGCVIDYRIQDVYVYENGTSERAPKYVAAFLNVTTPGFEGDDVMYMVVTGELN